MLFISSIEFGCTENGIYEAKYSSTATHKSFPMHYGQWGETKLFEILKTRKHAVN